MRASVSALAAILGVAQLAAASAPGDGARAARIARDGFYTCALMTVPDNDDRISPADNVAKAVAAKCRSWVDAMLRQTARTEALEQYNEVMRGEDGTLLGLVLRHRVLQAAPPPPPPPPPIVVARAGRPPPKQPVPGGRSTIAKRTAPGSR